MISRHTQLSSTIISCLIVSFVPKKQITMISRQNNCKYHFAPRIAVSFLQILTQSYTELLMWRRYQRIHTYILFRCTRTYTYVNACTLSRSLSDTLSHTQVCTFTHTPTPTPTPTYPYPHMHIKTHIAHACTHFVGRREQEGIRKRENIEIEIDRERSREGERSRKGERDQERERDREREREKEIERGRGRDIEIERESYLLEKCFCRCIFLSFLQDLDCLSKASFSSKLVHLLSIRMYTDYKSSYGSPRSW